MGQGIKTYRAGVGGGNSDYGFQVIAEVAEPTKNNGNTYITLNIPEGTTHILIEDATGRFGILPVPISNGYYGGGSISCYMAGGSGSGYEVHVGYNPLSGTDDGFRVSCNYTSEWYWISRIAYVRIG